MDELMVNRYILEYGIVIISITYVIAILEAVSYSWDNKERK